MSCTLFVSFWHVGLGNIPEGTFTHRLVPAADARSLIEEARAAGLLSCASHDDLFAPYHKQERRRHKELRRVLRAQYDIALSLNDFTLGDEFGDEAGVTLRPLVLASIARSAALLVVNCHYIMSSNRKKKRLKFNVDPESVTFHLFEAMG